MRSGLSVWALCLVLFVAAPGAAQAQFDDDWRYYRSDGSAQPLDRILPEIRRNHPGRFYDAEGPFMGSDGQMHYRVKWMTPEGRVVWFDANARTGRVLGTGGGRHGFDEYGGYGEAPRNFGNEPPRNFGEGPNGGAPFGMPPNRGAPHGWNGGHDFEGGRNFGGGHGWGGGFWGGGGGGDRGHHGH